MALASGATLRSRAVALRQQSRASTSLRQRRIVATLPFKHCAILRDGQFSVACRLHVSLSPQRRWTLCLARRRMSLHRFVSVWLYYCMASLLRFSCFFVCLSVSVCQATDASSCMNHFDDSLLLSKIVSNSVLSNRILSPDDDDGDVFILEEWLASAHLATLAPLLFDDDDDISLLIERLAIPNVMLPFLAMRQCVWQNGCIAPSFDYGLSFVVFSHPLILFVENVAHRTQVFGAFGLLIDTHSYGRGFCRADHPACTHCAEDELCMQSFASDNRLFPVCFCLKQQTGSVTPAPPCPTVCNDCDGSDECALLGYDWNSGAPMCDCFENVSEKKSVVVHLLTTWPGN